MSTESRKRTKNKRKEKQKMIETPVISDQSVNAVLQRLDTLAAKLGVTAQYIYGVYVQQSRVEAIRDIISGLALLVITLLLLLFSRWLLFKRDNDCDDWPYFIGAGCGIASLILGGLSFSCFYTALGEWLNPQFWALDALFKAIH